MGCVQCSVSADASTQECGGIFEAVIASRSEMGLMCLTQRRCLSFLSLFSGGLCRSKQYGKCCFEYAF